MLKFICKVFGHVWHSTGWWEDAGPLGNWHRDIRCDRCGHLVAQSCHAPGKPLNIIPLKLF